MWYNLPCPCFHNQAAYHSNRHKGNDSDSGCRAARNRCHLKTRFGTSGYLKAVRTLQRPIIWNREHEAYTISVHMHVNLHYYNSSLRQLIGIMLAHYAMTHSLRNILEPMRLEQ